MPQPGFFMTRSKNSSYSGETSFSNSFWKYRCLRVTDVAPAVRFLAEHGRDPVVGSERFFREDQFHVRAHPVGREREVRRERRARTL